MLVDLMQLSDFYLSKLSSSFFGNIKFSGDITYKYRTPLNMVRMIVLFVNDKMLKYLLQNHREKFIE